MYWFLLIVCSLPIYGVIGWLIFDTADNAAESFYDTVVFTVKEILFDRIFYFMSGEDFDRAGSAMTLGIFLFACSAATYGEHLLVQRVLHGPATMQEQEADAVPVGR